MTDVFNEFTRLFEERYKRVSVLNMGEDSVRYDFFQALQTIKHLQPWDLQLEYPIHESAFVRTDVPGRKRNEKPQIDLFVDTPEVKLCAEFGMFRRNSNDNGTIAQTENTFKMFNDFIRLALHAHFHVCDAYFVCVADRCMLHHQPNIREIPSFPGKSYSLGVDLLKKIEPYKCAKVLDRKFLNKKSELELSIDAILIHDLDIHSELNPFETKILVWRVSSEIRSKITMVVPEESNMLAAT